MKDIKMIFTDMDGTLLTSEHIISDFTKKTLKEYQDRGTAVILASGRNIDSLMKLGEELRISQYPQSGYICLNGLEVRDYQGNCLHSEKQLSYQDVVLIDKISDQYHLDMVMFFDHEIYVVEHGKTGIMEYHFLTTSKHLVETLEDVPQDKFVSLKKVAILQDEKVISQCLKKIQVQTQGILEFNLVESDWVEISGYGINKGNALKKFVSLYQATIEECIAFGNGENDISMLEEAGVGIAMGNSFEIVKEKADVVCLDNDHDGIGHYLMEDKCETKNS